MQPANTLALGGSFEGATQAPGSPRQTPTASPRPYLTGPPNSGSGLEASKNARGGARAASKVRVVSHTKVKYGVPESPRESIDGDATAPPEKDASNPVPATAKVALLVLKFCANITASIAKKKGGEGRWAWRLRRIMNAGLMRRILRCIAMWDQFASKHLVWHGPPWRDGKTVTISGGCWQISQESVVTVSDVVDAMLQHMRSGAGADDLQGFVETYTKSSRRRLAVRSYGARDREARREARAHLQTGFRRVQSSTKKFRQEMGLLASDLNRANFSNKSMQTQEQNILSKEKATQMALRHGQVTSDAALATHRIFMFQQMARLQPSIKNVGRDIKGLPLLESPEQRDWQAEGTDWQAGQAEDGEASPSEDEEETRAQRLWRKVRRNLHILIKQKQNEERRRSSVGQLADVPIELRQRVKQVLRLNDAEAHAQRIVDLVQWRGVLSGTAAASTGKVRFAALLQVMNKGIIELQELVQTVTFEEEQVVQMQSDLQGIITDRIEQEEVNRFTQFARTGDIAEDVMQFVEKSLPDKAVRENLLALRYKHQALKAELDKRMKETDEEEELLFQLEQVPLESAEGAFAEAMEQVRRMSTQGARRSIGDKEKSRPETEEYTKLLQDVVEYAMQTHTQINSLWPVGVSGAGDAMLTIVDHYKSAMADLGEAIGGSLKASPEVLEKSASKWLRTGEQLCEALHKFSVSIAQDPLPDEVVKHLLQRAETAIQQTPAADRKGADQSPRQAPAGQPPGAAGPPAEDGRPRELLPRQTNKFTKAVGTVAAATMACRVAKRSSAEDAKEEIKNLIEQVLQEMPPTSEVVKLAQTCAELGDNIESVSQRRQKLKDHIGELQGRLRSLAEEAEAAAAPSPMRSREPSAERAAAAAAAWMDAANAGPGKGGSRSPSKRRTVRLEDAAKLVAQQAAEEGAVGPRAGPSPRLSPRGVSSAAASPRLAPPGGGPAAGRGGAGRGASKEQPRQEETTDNAGEEAAMNRTRLQAAQAKLDSSKQSRTELQAKCSALAAELQRLRALLEAQKRADAELVALETASTPAAAVKATRPPKEQAELAQTPALPSPEVEEQRRPAGIDSDTERERGPEGAGVPGAPDVSGPRDHAVAPPPKAAGQPEPAAGASGAGHGAEEQGRQEAAETEERSAALVRPCGAASASRSALAPPMEAQSPAGLRPPPPAAAAEDAGAPQNAAPAVGTAEAASAVLVDEGTREPLEPWLQAFPEDSPEDAFARFDFCSRFGLEPQSLYDGATQQTVLTQLRHQIAQKRLLLEQLAPSKASGASQEARPAEGVLRGLLPPKKKNKAGGKDPARDAAADSAKEAAKLSDERGKLEERLSELRRAAEEMQKKLLEPSAREKEAFEKEVMSALHHVDRVVRQITATKDAIAVAALMAVATSSLSLADATSSTSSLHSASKGLLKHFQKVRQGLFVKAAKKVALVRRLGVSQAVQEPTKPTKSLAEALAETLDKDARPRRMSQQGGFAALNLQHAALADRSTVVDKDSEAARRAPMLLHGASHAPPQLNSKTASQAKDDHSDTPSELQDEQAEDPMRHWTDGHLHEAQEGANGRRASRGQLVKKRASLMPWASMLPMASMVQDPQSEPEHLLGAPFAQAMSDPGPRRKVPATVFGGRFALSSAAKAGGPAASIGAVNAERLGGKPEELTFRAVSNERMVEQQTESARQQDPRMHPSTTADLSSMVMVAKKVSHSKSKEPVPLMCNLEEVPEEPDEDERQRQEPPESRSGAQSPATSSSGKASTTGGSDDVPARKVATLASALGTMSSALRSLPVGQQGKRKKRAKGMRFVLTEQSDGDDMTRRNAMFYVDELQAKVSRVRSGGWGAKMAMEPVLSDLLMASNCEAETLFETSLEEIKSKPQDQRGEIASRLVAMERARLRRPGRQTGQELPNEVVKACKQVLGELGSFITEGLPSESVSSSGGSDRDEADMRHRSTAFTEGKWEELLGGNSVPEMSGPISDVAQFMKALGLLDGQGSHAGAAENHSLTEKMRRTGRSYMATLSMVAETVEETRERGRRDETSALEQQAAPETGSVDQADQEEAPIEKFYRALKASLKPKRHGQAPWQTAALDRVQMLRDIKAFARSLERFNRPLPRSAPDHASRPRPPSRPQSARARPPQRPRLQRANSAGQALAESVLDNQKLEEWKTIRESIRELKQNRMLQQRKNLVRAMAAVKVDDEEDGGHFGERLSLGGLRGFASKGPTHVAWAQEIHSNLTKEFKRRAVAAAEDPMMKHKRSVRKKRDEATEELMASFEKAPGAAWRSRHGAAALRRRPSRNALFMGELAPARKAAGWRLDRILFGGPGDHAHSSRIFHTSDSDSSQDPSSAKRRLGGKFLEMSTDSVEGAHRAGAPETGEPSEDGFALGFDVPFEDIQPAAFKTELHRCFQSLGVDEVALSRVSIDIYEDDGAIIAHTHGHPDSIRMLKAVKLSTIEVVKSGSQMVLSVYQTSARTPRRSSCWPPAVDHRQLSAAPAAAAARRQLRRQNQFGVLGFVQFTGPVAYLMGTGPAEFKSTTPKWTRWVTERRARSQSPEIRRMSASRGSVGADAWPQLFPLEQLGGAPEQAPHHGAPRWPSPRRRPSPERPRSRSPRPAPPPEQADEGHAPFLADFRPQTPGAAAAAGPRGSGALGPQPPGAAAGAAGAQGEPALALGSALPDRATSRTTSPTAGRAAGRAASLAGAAGNGGGVPTGEPALVLVAAPEELAAPGATGAATPGRGRAGQETPSERGHSPPPGAAGAAEVPQAAPWVPLNIPVDNSPVPTQVIDNILLRKPRAASKPAAMVHLRAPSSLSSTLEARLRGDWAPRGQREPREGAAPEGALPQAPADDEPPLAAASGEDAARPGGGAAAAHALPHACQSSAAAWERHFFEDSRPVVSRLGAGGSRLPDTAPAVALGPEAEAQLRQNSWHEAAQHSLQQHLAGLRRWRATGAPPPASARERQRGAVDVNSKLDADMHRTVRSAEWPPPKAEEVEQASRRAEQPGAAGGPAALAERGRPELSRGAIGPAQALAQYTQGFGALDLVALLGDVAVDDAGPGAEKPRSRGADLRRGHGGGPGADVGVSIWNDFRWPCSDRQERQPCSCGNTSFAFGARFCDKCGALLPTGLEELAAESRSGSKPSPLDRATSSVSTTLPSLLNSPRKQRIAPQNRSLASRSETWMTTSWRSDVSQESWTSRLLSDSLEAPSVLPRGSEDEPEETQAPLHGKGRRASTAGCLPKLKFVNEESHGEPQVEFEIGSMPPQAREHVGMSEASIDRLRPRTVGDFLAHPGKKARRKGPAAVPDYTAQSSLLTSSRWSSSAQKQPSPRTGQRMRAR